MKQFFVFALVLSLCACGARSAPDLAEETAEAEFCFDATILELYEGGGVLSLALSDDPIRASSDLISFGTAELPDIGAAVGDTVRVYYNGIIMESYPAQIAAIGWVLLETAAEGASTFDVSFGCARLALAADWAFDSVSGEDGTGIAFWCEAEPALYFEFLQQDSPVGICGTGVSFEAASLQSGYATTICTEVFDDGTYWFLMLFDEPYQHFSVRGTVSIDVWEAYRGEVWTILNSISFDDDRAGC